MGALSSIMDIGHSTGPLLTGILITVFGYYVGFFSGLLLTGVVILYFWVATRSESPVRIPPGLIFTELRGTDAD